MEKDKFVAQSYDGIKWFACIYSNLARSYVRITASPVFESPELAIIWAKNNWQ